MYAVLLQWFLLLAGAAAVVLTLSFAGAQKNLVEDRLLLARTIAHHADATVSAAMQSLGRLASDLSPLAEDAAGRLHTFRLHSPFREAAYVVDARGRVVVGDPADVRALPPQRWPPREVVTPLIRKWSDDARPVVAIVQPLPAASGAYHLVSEMQPSGSVLSAFLHDLGPDPDTHVVVVDDSGTIVASSDPSQLFRTLPRAEAYRERIRAHRPLVTEDLTCEFASDAHAGADAVAVMVPLRFAPWAVMIQQHKAQAFAGLYRTRRGLVIAGLMLAAMGLLLSRALSRSVVAPIQQLSREAEAIRAGDLSRPITVSGDREIEVLARTLDGARERLAAALRELQALNEDLEGQVAARTRVIERKYEDLRLLHAVAELSTREHEPGRVCPEILRLVAGHYGLSAVALVTRPPGAPSATYVVPAGAALPWLGAGGPPPPDWQRRDIVYQGRLQAELLHPRTESLDEQVLDALSHQLAVSLHGAHLWQRTVEQDEQRQVLVRRLLSAAEEERRRLARELHDEISQLLTVIQLSLDRVSVDTEDMARAKDLLVRTQTEIHRIIYDLRPSLLDDLGLAAAVKSHAHDHLVRAGLSVSLEVEEGLPSRPEIDIATFRIYQELATNILRHARAEHVSVELYERDRRLILAVEDDGIGFDPNDKSGGVGITGMRERVALVKGAIRIDSEPGSGTHVEVEIPIP